MSGPYIPSAQTGGQRGANGYVQMGGGYEDAVTQAQRGQQPAQQQVQYQPQGQQPQQVVYQPAPQQQFQPQPQPQVWAPGQGVMPQDGYSVQHIPPQQQVPLQQQRQPFPQQLAPWQQQPLPQQIPAGVDLSQRLSGPGIPPELQGRTVQELVAIHNGLRQVHIQNLSHQQPVQQNQVPVQQGIQQVLPGQHQQAGQWDWRNPAASTRAVVSEVIDQAITEKLGPMLAPLQQQSAMTSIQAARSQAVAQIGPQLFAQLEPLINQSLQGSNPTALMNPQMWVVAAERALGQMQLQQARGGPQAQPQNGVQYTQQGPGVYPVQQVAAGQQPLPNLNGFYTEQPNQGGPGVAMTGQLSQAQLGAASAMGMTPAVYAAWLGGVA